MLVIWRSYRISRKYNQAENRKRLKHEIAGEYEYEKSRYPENKRLGIAELERSVSPEEMVVRIIEHAKLRFSE